MKLWLVWFCKYRTTNLQNNTSTYNIVVSSNLHISSVDFSENRNYPVVIPSFEMLPVQFTLTNLNSLDLKDIIPSPCDSLDTAVHGEGRNLNFSPLMYMVMAHFYFALSNTNLFYCAYGSASLRSNV